MRLCPLIRSAVIGAALGAVQAVSAQDWPAKPVRLVITFPPGGPSEIVSRMVGERLQGVFKQPFVIENRVGASGNIGAEAVASAADGYSFGVTTDTLFTVNPHVFRKMPFDPWRDIVPVTRHPPGALARQFPQVEGMHPGVPGEDAGRAAAARKARAARLCLRRTR